MTRTGATRPDPAAPPPGTASLSSIRSFRRVWGALWLSGLGQWLSVPALVAIAVLSARGDGAARAQAAGGVLVLLVLPAVLLSPPAALLAARLDRRVALLAADAVRFAVVLSVPLLDARPWTLAASFLVGCASVVWVAAASATPPALVPAELGEEARRSAARAVWGPALAAAPLFAILALIARETSGAGSRADLALYVTAAVFLAAAAAVATAGDLPGGAPQGGGRRGEPAGAAGGGPAGGPDASSVPAHGGRAGGLRGGAQGAVRAPVPAPLRMLVQGPGGDVPLGARGLGLAVGGAVLAAAAAAAVARVHVARLGGGDAGFGGVLTGLVLGLGFGRFLGPRVLRPFSRRRLLGLAVITAALALVVIALVQNLVVVAFTAALLGVAVGGAWATAAAVVAGPDEQSGEARGGKAVDGGAPGGGRPVAYLGSVALVTVLVVAVVVPLAAGAIGARRLAFGDADYDFDGAGAAQLVVGLLALLAGLVAFHRLDDRHGVPLVADLRAAVQGRVYTPPEAAAAAEPPARRERGVFIAFEGGEGAGKTTQARLAAIWLRDHGYDVVTTHEPGATKIGMRLRAMLLDRETTGLSSRAETLLYAADRADHVANVIVPAMERGAIVVSDRYVDSSLAYQGFGREQPVEDIAGVNAWATGGLVPDLTVLLEVPPQTGLGRLSAPADRIESEPREFHERVRAGFRALADADPDRYLVLDASRPQGELSREIQYRIREILPDPVPAGTEDVTSTFPVITDF